MNEIIDKKIKLDVREGDIIELCGFDNIDDNQKFLYVSKINNGYFGETGSLQGIYLYDAHTVRTRLLSLEEIRDNISDRFKIVGHFDVKNAIKETLKQYVGDNT